MTTKSSTIFPPSIKKQFVFLIVPKRLKKISKDFHKWIPIRANPIWRNSSFTFKNKPIYFEHWIKSGILCTKDLYDMNGSLRQLEYFYDKTLWNQYFMWIPYSQDGILQIRKTVLMRKSTLYQYKKQVCSFER